MEKRTQVIGIRLTALVRRELDLISRLEGTTIAELVRGWIRDKVREYQKDPRYKRLEAEKDEDLAHRG